MPPVIIVGVTNTDRTRDLTPTNAPLAGRDGTPREFPTSGGASRFLDFFEKELFPYVDSHYRTQPYRLLAGHSFGGLFALNALFTRPAMFEAVIAVGPSLRWDDDLPLRQARSFLEDRKELNATLVVAMANEEEGRPAAHSPGPAREDAAGRRASTASSGRSCACPTRPTARPSCAPTTGACAGSSSRGTCPPIPRPGPLPGRLDELKAHYANLSKRYEFDVTPPENTVNQIGYQFLGRDDIDDAIAVFRYNVELYPDAANVHDSLGEALEQAGRLPEAFSTYSRAVDNATAVGDPRLEIFITNRDRVKEQL